MLTKILAYLKDPNSRTLILLIAVFIFGCLYLQQCNATKNAKQAAQIQQTINTQNQNAHDSEVIAKNKAGEVEALKFSFVTQMSDLKKLDDSLYKESQKEIGKLESIIKSNVTISSQPVTVSNSLVNYPDGETYGLKFTSDKLDSNFEWSIAGTSQFKIINNIITPGTTSITQNKIKIGIVLGFTQQTDGYHIFARSSSPDVQFSQLDGALIIPPPSTKNDILCPPAPPVKHFSIGPYLGVGFDGSLKPGLSVGIGITYSIIRL